MITSGALLSSLLPLCCSRGSALAQTEGVCMIPIVAKLQKKERNKEKEAKTKPRAEHYSLPPAGDEKFSCTTTTFITQQGPLRCPVYVQPLKNSFKSLSWIVIILHLHSHYSPPGMRADLQEEGTSQFDFGRSGCVRSQGKQHI